MCVTVCVLMCVILSVCAYVYAYVHVYSHVFVCLEASGFLQVFCCITLPHPIFEIRCHLN